MHWTCNLYQLVAGQLRVKESYEDGSLVSSLSAPSASFSCRERSEALAGPYRDKEIVETSSEKPSIKNYLVRPVMQVVRERYLV